MAASRLLARAPGGREAGDMASESGPRVLLGNLGPIMRLGMNRVLREQGCHVVGQEDRPSAIVGAAHRLRPDIVVLDLDEGSSHELAQLIRGASPETTVVLWARDEDLMEVLDPASSASRLVSAPVLERLRGELGSRQ
jgi:AmiR/NasT family two-component response regulator